MLNNKEKGNAGEDLVVIYYEEKGFVILDRNYTKKGAGEIDIIAEDNNTVRFIEVKEVDYIDDLYGYITPRKISNIKKTMQYFLIEKPTEKDVQIDVVFVKYGKVFEVFENIGN